MQYAGIVLDQSIGKILDYSIPLHLQGQVVVGSRVLIPIKNTLQKGTVWLIKKYSDVPGVKEIAEIATSSSVITKDLIKLAEWMSYYYATPLSRILHTILPKHIREHEKERSEIAISPLSSESAAQTLILSLAKKAPKQAAVIEALIGEKEPTPLSRLLKKAKVSRAPVDALLAKGALCAQSVPKEKVCDFEAEYFLSSPKTLSPEQNASFEKVCQGLESNAFSPHLLFGVTGSGKTEIYLQAITKALSQDKGVIFLVPEIALATQTLERLKSRFEERIAVLHHRLSNGERKESWYAIHSRKARIIIGARSAIFCPVPNLGLIIIDEEQENAYKQTGESPYYHARDVAVMRAKLSEATIILGSATPSLESYQNALQNKYILSELTKRPDSATLPAVHIVDMKLESLKQKRRALFSDPLLRAIKKRLQIGEQTLLLLNRRGYHTSQVCPNCSFASKCPHCETLLTFHRQENRLSCHLCSYVQPPARTCPSCKSGVPMKFKGAGTEMAERALQSMFPDSRILRMDADTTRKKDSHESLFKKFRSGKADILVGTQMIAKGLHFPSVTLVGVLDADLTLSIPDFRAAESLFQLITQVAGRSGRSDLPGEVFVQTFLPKGETLLLAAKQDYAAFFKEEAAVREMFGYPPFTHLIKIGLSGPNETEVEKKAQEVRAFLIGALPDFFEILQVAASGHAKIEDQYRFQFILKSKKILAGSSVLSTLGQKFRSGKIRLTIDIDPSSTFF
jgi:primosomal protein N' (replication factor Y) (superfamily II helicase)